MRKFEIKEIDSFATAKILVISVFLATLCSGVVSTIVYFLQTSSEMTSPEGLYMKKTFLLEVTRAVLVQPIAVGTGALLLTFFYNLLARRFGGIVFNLVEVQESDRDSMR